jgi:hypothetical protein
MGIQVVAYQGDALSLCILRVVHHRAYLLGPIHRRFVSCDFHLPSTRQRFYKHPNNGHAVREVFVIAFQWCRDKLMAVPCTQVSCERLGNKDPTTDRHRSHFRKGA